MAIAKVQIGDNTELDLSNDTVDASHLAEGYTAHGHDGEPILGTMPAGGGEYTLFAQSDEPSNPQEGDVWVEIGGDMWEKICDVTVEGEEVLEITHSFTEEETSKILDADELVVILDMVPTTDESFTTRGSINLRFANNSRLDGWFNIMIGVATTIPAFGGDNLVCINHMILLPHPPLSEADVRAYRLTTMKSAGGNRSVGNVTNSGSLSSHGKEPKLISTWSGGNPYGIGTKLQVYIK